MSGWRASMNKYVAELIGTFALVFAGTGAVVVDGVSGGVIGHVGVAMTFGLVVMAMIYAVGDTSGAHLNPAVTVGFWLGGRFPVRDIAPYVVSQLVGAVLASVLLAVMFRGHPTLGATIPRGSAVQSLVLEGVLSFFLMFVILCVATGAKEKGLMAGIAIGGTVGLDALFGGPISGASMNPARSVAPAVMSGRVEHLWVYLVGPVAGAAAAVPCWRLVRTSGATSAG